MTTATAHTHRHTPSELVGGGRMDTLAHLQRYHGVTASTAEAGVVLHGGLHADDDAKTACPSCGQAQIVVVVQVTATLNPGARRPEASLATTDDFVEASCSREECTVGLAQEMGDGRLRKALLEDLSTGEEVEDDELRARWQAAVEAAIDGQAWPLEEGV